MMKIPIQTMTKTVDIATRKQCKYAHTYSLRLPVNIPQTPKIVNFVDGCAFKER